MIKVNNTYSQLKELILGKISYDFVKHLPEHKQKKIEYILKQTEDDLEEIQSILEKQNIKVLRPERKIEYDREIKTPLWSEIGLRYPIAPRDIFLVVGDTIIETASTSRYRYFEHWAYKDLMIDYFKQGAKWIAMPSPILGDESYDIDEDIYTTNYEPLLEAAGVIQHDNDILVSTCVTSNSLGIQWLKNTLGNNYRYHEMSYKFPGHLDAHICIVRPGLIATYHKKEDFPEYFKDWEFIDLVSTLDREISRSQEFIHENLQDDDHLNTNLICNLLSINENKLLLYDHHKDNKQLLDTFEKYDIEPIFVPFKYCHFFNQGITCITLETIRE